MRVCLAGEVRCVAILLWRGLTGALASLNFRRIFLLANDNETCMTIFAEIPRISPNKTFPVILLFPYEFDNETLEREVRRTIVRATLGDAIRNGLTTTTIFVARRKSNLTPAAFAVVVDSTYSIEHTDAIRRLQLHRRAVLQDSPRARRSFGVDRPSNDVLYTPCNFQEPGRVQEPEVPCWGGVQHAEMNHFLAISPCKAGDPAEVRRSKGFPCLALCIGNKPILREPRTISHLKWNDRC